MRIKMKMMELRAEKPLIVSIKSSAGPRLTKST